MDRSRVAPELRYLTRGSPFGLLEYAWARRLSRLLIKLLPTLPIKGVTIESVAGAPKLRIYRPERLRTDAGLLYMHGGGYVTGSPRAYDFSCGDLCRRLGMIVVSVNYRLAPEHRFPVPAADCLAAWHWLQRSAASLGIDPARVAIGGTSAGGGLAAGLVLRIRDAGGVQPIAQWLLAPMLDDRTATRRDLDDLKYPVTNNRMNRALWHAFLGKEPGTEDVPAYAAPARRDDLAGLPPTFIGVGDVDLFHEEGRSYADRLRRGGVMVTFESVQGAPHGFEELARRSRISEAFRATASDWLRGVIDTRSSATSSGAEANP